MRDETRKKIKLYLKELYSDLKVEGIDGIVSRLNYPVTIDLFDDHEAEVRVQSLSTTNNVRDTSPRQYQKVFTVTIEVVYAPFATDYDKNEILFDDLITEISFRLEQDEFLTDPEIRKKSGSGDFELNDAVFQSLDFRTEPDGQRPLYFCLLRYLVTYDLPVGVSPDPLDDLKRIDADVDSKDIAKDIEF